MNTPVVTVEGIVKPDGTVEVPEKVNLPAGKVLPPLLGYRSGRDGFVCGILSGDVGFRDGRRGSRMRAPGVHTIPRGSHHFPGVCTPGYVMSPRSGARNMGGRRIELSRGLHPGLRDVAPFRGSEHGRAADRAFPGFAPRAT
jgi:hypothetical protein